MVKDFKFTKELKNLSNQISQILKIQKIFEIERTEKDKTFGGISFPKLCRKKSVQG